MRKFHCVSSLLRDDYGATAIEYGLIAALIAVAAIAGMSAVGSGLTGLFNTVSSDLLNGRLFAAMVIQDLAAES